MENGKVAFIFVSSAARARMVSLDEVWAMDGRGLAGDRYSSGKGRAITRVKSAIDR